MTFVCISCYSPVFNIFKLGICLRQRVGSCLSAITGLSI